MRVHTQHFKTELNYSFVLIGEKKKKREGGGENSTFQFLKEDSVLQKASVYSAGICTTLSAIFQATIKIILSSSVQFCSVQVLFRSICNGHPSL